MLGRSNMITIRTLLMSNRMKNSKADLLTHVPLHQEVSEWLAWAACIHQHPCVVSTHAQCHQQGRLSQTAKSTCHETTQIHKVLHSLMTPCAPCLLIRKAPVSTHVVCFLRSRGAFVRLQQAAGRSSASIAFPSSPRATQNAKRNRWVSRVPRGSRQFA